MPHYVQFGEGEEMILIEVAPPEPDEDEYESIEKVAFNWFPTVGPIRKATTSFDVALAKSIKPVASALFNEVKSLPNPPDALEVRFGLIVSVGGATVIPMGGSHNFEVILRWSSNSLA